MASAYEHMLAGNPLVHGLAWAIMGKEPFGDYPIEYARRPTGGISRMMPGHRRSSTYTVNHPLVATAHAVVGRSSVHERLEGEVTRSHANDRSAHRPSSGASFR
jgi:hypothetical protein